jgi:hypothetical protein
MSVVIGFFKLLVSIQDSVQCESILGHLMMSVVRCHSHEQQKGEKQAACVCAMIDELLDRVCVCVCEHVTGSPSFFH